MTRTYTERMPDPSPDERPADPYTVAGEPPVPTGIPWGAGFGLLISVLLVVFAVQNTQDVPIRFLAWEWAFPLVIVIVGVTVLAVVITSIAGWGVRRRRRRRAAEKAELRRLRSTS
jgi:uncharacterized integral membrane protein